MTHYYCTVLSKGYVHRGLILYNSLKKYDQDFYFFFVCMDDEVSSLLERMALDRAVLLTMKQIEAQDPELAAVKATRNDKEYVWSSKGSVFLYLFRYYPMINHIVWLDGDIEFYSDTEPIFDELMKCSILLTKERFVETDSGLNDIYGIFNTGLMGFNRNDNAINCIRWFRSKCIEWCYDRVESGKWSDQMYVNNWPDMFNDVRVIEDIGINVTAWNIQGAEVSKLDNDIYINGEKLVFYHYSGLKFMNYSKFDLCSYIKLPEDVKELIYKPYIEKYRNMVNYVNGFVDNFYNGLNYQVYEYRNYYGQEVKEQKDNQVNYFYTITTNSYLLKALALYESICMHMGCNFHMWICTIDKLAYDILIKLNLPYVSIVDVGEIENECLLEAKNNRRLNEYCWTIKASLVKFILKQHNYIDSILYLDSDTLMFSNPYPLFDRLDNNDILLTSHNFTGCVGYSTRQKGLYNAGIVGFKNSRNALRILNWWEKRCIEWCYDDVQPDRFGDQKYLETIKNKHSKTVVIESVGGNAAMWNIEYCDIKSLDNKVYINNDILIFFHFCIFFIISENEFELWKCVCPKIENSAMNLIFIPYVQAIKNAINKVKKYETDISIFLSDNRNSDIVYNYLKL